MNLKIEELWEIKNYIPNDNQKKAIMHTEGPLLVTAGPGSGKTRVILWRTLNLIVFKGIKPEEIFLATFTEKAARQLKDGLRSLLTLASERTKITYDISGMAIGTVHSICRDLLNDRRFSANGERPSPPILMDALGQFFFVNKKSNWTELWKAGGYNSEEEANGELNKYLANYNYPQKFKAVTEMMSIFNRFSEENLEIDSYKKDPILNKILKMYKKYKELLESKSPRVYVDFSLLQKRAFDKISKIKNTDSVFKYVIIDEYQDTNSIQESLYFYLSKGTKNICVVGDDDQALYRFRGATVENLVEFESRYKNANHKKPERIDLNINYRSRKQIVDTYTKFISLIDWKDTRLNKYYRVMDKNIQANSRDSNPSVLFSEAGDADSVCLEIAELCYKLRLENKVSDYNQIAILFPYLKGNPRVEKFAEAFENINDKYNLSEGNKHSLKYYAPRASSFLNTEEAKLIWGMIIKIFDRAHYGAGIGTNLSNFRNWKIASLSYVNKVFTSDTKFNKFVDLKREEIERIKSDYEILLQFSEKKKWDLESKLIETQLDDLIQITKLSKECKRDLKSKRLRTAVKDGKFKISYVFNRVTTLDWTLLDLFYQFTGFDYIKQKFDLAEDGTDEGPIVNFAQISKYLARFMEDYAQLISASFLRDDKFHHSFYTSFTYSLYRLSESEVEDEENPFPKGRISFLTLHQSKGLEFPVVILGSVYKIVSNVPPKRDEIIKTLLNKEGEPLERISNFDMMRMFYVGMSRAKSLLVIPRYSGKGIRNLDVFKNLFKWKDIISISNFSMNSLPKYKEEEEDIGKSYSYTSDYLMYDRCPRQYMLIKKHGFVESRSQTMIFGSLVHQTIEDLHHLVLNQRGN